MEMVTALWGSVDRVATFSKALATFEIALSNLKKKKDGNVPRRLLGGP